MEIVVPADAQATNQGTHTLTANTAYELLAADDTRLQTVLSATVANAWVALGDAAVVGQGIPLIVGADPVVISGWAGAINVISSGAAVVAYTEFVGNVGDDGGEMETGSNAFVPAGPSDNYFETAIASTPETLANSAGPGGTWVPNTAEGTFPVQPT